MTNKDKYIIRNCPMYFHSNCYGHTGNCYCQDCTDCVMKQIVELCKEEQQSRVATNILSNKILQLLDIQEVYK